MLLTRGMPRILKALLDGNARARCCELIAYCLMPDHLHVLAYVARPGGDVLSFFEDFKRGAANAAMRSGIDYLWQRDFWDRHTRSDKDLSRCVQYILWNPVAEGLCRRPEEWQYTEFRGYPRPQRRTDNNDNDRAGT